MIIAVIQTFMPIVTILGVAVLLLAHRSDDVRLKALGKAVASGSFVVLGLLRWSSGSTFDRWMVAALILGAAGDMLLLADRTFVPGLVAFLLEHLCLIAAFLLLLPVAEWPFAAALPVVALAVAIVRWLWPHLGRLKGPVALYILAISVMVWGALSLAFRGALPWWVGAAGVLFLLSDITVARQRFVTPGLSNRVVGLPMYYTAQVLLALTIGR